MIFGSLRNRIVFFFAILLALVQAIAFLFVNTASLQIAKQENAQELGVGERIFQRLLAQNRQELTEAARILSADFGFREAVSTSDLGTMVSALNNHGTRIGADVMMLISPDNILLADTLHPTLPPGPSPLGTLIQAAQSQGDASAVMLLEQRAYQLVVVPVLAPDLVAWVAMGFLIDDELANDLRGLTNLHVSFLSKQENNPWTLLASTQLLELRKALLTKLGQAAASNPSVTLSATVDGYETRVSTLERQGDTWIIAVLQRSTQAALEPLDRLRIMLLGLALASLAISVLGSIVIVRKITRPLNVLAGVAQKIKQGDYSQAANIAQSDEIGALAESFNHMRDSIQVLLRLAYEDVLTGLPNRAMFNDRLNQMVKLAKRTGMSFFVLMMDLNRFKYVNDTLGHEAGDRVIKTVGERLRGILRESDTVARLGGDEFAILLATGDPEKLNRVVQKIQSNLETPILIENQPVDIGFSIGSAIYPEHGEDAGTLMRRADVAMYVAKRTRSDSVIIYDSHHDTYRQEHLSLQGELRKAIESDELELHYQPKVDLVHPRIVAVEALIRWRHPQRGMILPSEFIPFAEHTGAIRLVTRWVIKTAIRQCGIWLAQGLHIKVSMNISARDLLNRDLPNLVEHALHANKVPASMVCLEITESALMEDPIRARETVINLRKLEVELSIDDYGTGYSSLAYVKKLPVTELKIDHAFVMNMTSHHEDAAIVRSTIELGHNLGLHVVAEGVESEETMKLLRQLGCDQAQGYLVSKPMPADQLQQWLNESPWGNIQGTTPELSQISRESTYSFS